MSEKTELQMSRLGQMIRLYCRMHEISERELARRMDVPSATLHRFIHGEETTLSTGLHILNWLLQVAV